MISDWFKTGSLPPREELTVKQKFFLIARAESVRDILTPEERCNAEIMGFDAWLAALEKDEASALIRRLKGEEVLGDIRRVQGGIPQKWWNKK